MKKSALLATAALLCAGLSTAFAHADTVNLSLTNPTPTTTAGTVLEFEATVSAPLSNSGLEYLNSDNFTVSGPSTLDDSPFFANFPAFLSPGDSVTDILFDISVPAGSLPGSIVGSFQILGGSSDSDLNTLANVDFSATIAGATSVTPEPSSFLLLGTGLLGFVGAARRRMKATAAIQ